MREKYESLALAQLKELAKVRGIAGAATMKKSEVVEAMLAEDENISIVDAIKKLYSSNMYKKLEDESSKAWHLGPITLYEDFIEEHKRQER